MLGLTKTLDGAGMADGGRVGMRKPSKGGGSADGQMMVETTAEIGDCFVQHGKARKR